MSSNEHVWRWLPTLAAIGLGAAACTVGPPAFDDADSCGTACEQLAGERAAVLRDDLRDSLLRAMEQDATIFGQQRFNLTGVDELGEQWLADETHIDESDARRVTGSHPGVLGIDVWDLAIKPAGWTPTPAVHAQAARHVFAQGGVVTMEWHMRGCGATDSFYAAGNEDCLCRLANDDAFARSWLLDGKLSRFADAVAAHGLSEVPIIVRPFHEMTGDWFWWGYSFWNCADRIPGATFTGPAAYQRLYRATVDYLRDERELRNLLFAYSPDKLDRGIGASEEERYLAGYPGDQYVDLLGIDLYYLADQSFAEQTARYRRYLALVTRLARERGKVAALTETGNYRLAMETTAAESRWFTEHLLPLLHGDAEIRLAFALTWENRRAAPHNVYVPFPGHPGADDFRAFAASPGIHMMEDVAPYPTCATCDSDPDGDGWGWENQQSCIVPAGC